MGVRPSAWAILTLAAALCACASMETRPKAQTLTKIESRTLPAEIVTDRVLDQLSDILTLETIATPSPHPRRPLSHLWFRTQARATAFIGLCTAEDLSFDFQPAGDVRLGAETPTRVRNVGASRIFHFLTPPAASTIPSVRDVARQNLDAACAAAGTRSRHFFAAPDAQTAVEGAWLVRNVLDQVSSGQVEFEISCPHSRSPCEQLLTGVQFAWLSGVRGCTRGGDAMRCWLADIGSLELTVFAEREEPIRKIVRVVVEELIIVADVPID
jgi:hypothetical protein